MGGLAALNENRQRDEVTETTWGLQYEILASGPEDGPHPSVSNPCLVHYTGMLLNGNVFDSSVQRGTPITFQPREVIKGWNEALQLMRPGDKWKLWLPSELAYGESGAGGSIPGGAMLVFEVELLEVHPEVVFPMTIVNAFKDQPMLIVVIGFGLYILYGAFTDIRSRTQTKKQLPISEAADAKENVNVFFEVQVGDSKETHRIEMTLFSKHYPKTAENFRALCTGEKGKGKSGKELTYRGSKFHKAIKGCLLEGGDFTSGKGTGGESIYGPKFDDEWDNGYIAHDRPYLLSMVNSGPNSNNSQFFLTVDDAKRLDGKHVVFGQVKKESQGAVVKVLETVGTESGLPKRNAIIKACGEIKSKTT